MNIRKLLLFLAIGIVSTCCAFAHEPAQNLSKDEKSRPTIVLVHGAWADGSSWRHVIPLLERHGYTVIAVQNPLTSLADDIASTRRVIDAQKGPVVVVGHSYGGAVITAAAAGNANVKALVYVAAFAPNSGEPLGALLEKFGPSALAAALVPDHGGYVWIDRAKFHDVFAKDLPAGESNLLAVAQKPISGATFGASLERAAWQTIPSWYVVAKDDRTLKPELQRFFAQRMKATTSEVKASHVAYISQPDVITRVIEEAAGRAGR